MGTVSTVKPFVGATLRMARMVSAISVSNEKGAVVPLAGALTAGIASGGGLYRTRLLAWRHHIRDSSRRMQRTPSEPQGRPASGIYRG